MARLIMINDNGGEFIAPALIKNLFIYVTMEH